MATRRLTIATPTLAGTHGPVAAAETLEVFGARIRQARALRATTTESLATELDWPESKLNHHENAPSIGLEPADLAVLAAALRFPPQFFTTEPTRRVHTDDLLHHLPHHQPADREILAQYAGFAAELLDQLDGRWALPPLRLVHVEADLGPVAAAARVRCALRVGDSEPIEYLTHSIESAGVPIAHRPTTWPAGAASVDLPAGTVDPAAVYAVYLTTPGVSARPVIIAQRSTSWALTRLRLAHTLGHLVMHASGTITARKHQQAARFAAELLAPAAAVAGELPLPLTVGTLLPMALRWGIGLNSLIEHLHSAGAITDNDHQDLTTELHEQSTTALDYSRAVEAPRLLSKWLELAYTARSAAELTAAHPELIFPGDLLADLLAGQRPCAAASPPAALIHGLADGGAVPAPHHDEEGR